MASSATRNSKYDSLDEGISNSSGKGKSKNLVLFRGYIGGDTFITKKGFKGQKEDRYVSRNFL